MIVTPYSALNESTELAPIAANFPALKHLFLFNEAAGSATLTDSVGGVILPATLTAGSVANTLKITETSVRTPTAGTFLTVSAAGTTTVVLMVGQMPASNGFALGAAFASGARFSIYSSATGNTLSDAVPTAISANAGAGYTATPAGFCGIIETGGYVRNIGGTSTSVNESTASIGLVSTLTGTNYSIANSFVSNSANIQYGMIQIWQFAKTTAPVDIKAAVAWTIGEWVSGGRKSVYPGFLGRT